MALAVVSVQPDASSTGVILQGAVIVTFDSEIDTTTYDESSFLLSAVADTPNVNPNNLPGNSTPVNGREYVDGIFSFVTNSAGQTVATFRPNRPLRPNVVYSCLISTSVQSATGESLSDVYTWDFTTGVLNLTVPPRQNPLPSQVGRIRPCDITVTPASSINNDLHRIEVTFSDAIDPQSIDLDSVVVNLEAFLLDPEVIVPAVQSKVVTIEGKKLIIELVF